MCFSAHVSITAYLAGVLGSLRLWLAAGRPAEAAFYAWVVHMQLVEYFLWQSQPCQTAQQVRLNKGVSQVGVIVNHLELIVLWLAVSRFSRHRLPLWLDAFMLAFVAASMAYTGMVLPGVKCTTVTEESAPHLHWRWNEGHGAAAYYSSFLIALVLLSLYGLGNKHGIANALAILLSFGASYAVYGDKHAIGAVWCLAASTAPWLLSLL
jgi:hypothetical protein